MSFERAIAETQRLFFVYFYRVFEKLRDTHAGYLYGTVLSKIHGPEFHSREIPTADKYMDMSD